MLHFTINNFQSHTYLSSCGILVYVDACICVPAFFLYLNIFGSLCALGAHWANWNLLFIEWNGGVRLCICLPCLVWSVCGIPAGGSTRHSPCIIITKRSSFDVIFIYLMFAFFLVFFFSMVDAFGIAITRFTNAFWRRAKEQQQQQQMVFC